MLQIVKNSLKKLSNHPKLRILLIVAAIIIVFIITMNLINSKNKTPAFNSAIQAASGGQATAPAISSQSAQYDALAKAQHTQDLENARKQGGTIFEDPLNKTSTKTEKNTPTAPTDSSNLVISPGSQKNLSDSDLSQQVQDLQAQLQATQAQQGETRAQAQMNNIMASMKGSLQSASGNWGLPTLKTETGANHSSGNDSGNNNNTNSQGPVGIKAGSILFGVIETSLDSDQPGTPVLATIVSGPYQGAKLIGSFAVAKNALVVQFNLMSLPNLSSTFAVNAYAIDSKTANNSVATSVNNHYLLRYGMLFASAFLQGFGNAFSNTTYTCPPDTPNCTVINTGTTNTENPSVTTQNAMYQGLGQVGTNVGQVAADQFNTPPTVQVAQGTGIGLLFMTDVHIPTNN